MSVTGRSDLIRKRAVAEYIEPARRNHRKTFSIKIKEFKQALEAREGFPTNLQAQFSSALKKRSFLQEQGLEIERLEGPRKGRGTNLILHLRFKDEEENTNNTYAAPCSSEASTDQRAERFVNSLRGLLRNEIQSFGGTEAFMRWVRSDEAQ